MHTHLSLSCVTSPHLTVGLISTRVKEAEETELQINEAREVSA